MSSVTITLEDIGQMVNASVHFSSDFCVESNAHQIGKLVMDYLDTILTKPDDDAVTDVVDKLEVA